METQNSIIDYWKLDHRNFLKCSLENFGKEVSFIQIELSESETTRSTLFWVKKSDFPNSKDAFLMLLEHAFLEVQEWDEFSPLKEADLDALLKGLDESYSKSSYESCEVSDLDQGFDKYVFKTLSLKDHVSIRNHEGPLTEASYFKLNPLLNEKIVRCNRSVFDSLDNEYYLETETYFVLFNWFTSA